ncbi:MAG: multiheme c-type cytochrome [candidate division Zixibacteria bacterium]|nr:multiheme c-type cytochrome [candidate division Zixibacteria bacterium]
MKKLTAIVLIISILTAFMAVSVFADEAVHEYVGTKKCKMCHKDVHASWLETKHADAFELLSAEEKKDEKCVACHTTGIDKKGKLIEGASCEACHGAGSDYKSPKIMSRKKWAADPEKHKKMAIEAGLIYPDTTICVKCHTKEGNDNFREFDIKKALGTSHPPLKKGK